MVDQCSLRFDKRWFPDLPLIRWMERETLMCPPPQDQISLRGMYKVLVTIPCTGRHLQTPPLAAGNKASYVAHPAQGSCVPEGTKRPGARPFGTKQGQLYAVASASLLRLCAIVHPPMHESTIVFRPTKLQKNTIVVDVWRKPSCWKRKKRRIHTAKWILVHVGNPDPACSWISSSSPWGWTRPFASLKKMDVRFVEAMDQAMKKGTERLFGRPRKRTSRLHPLLHLSYAIHRVEEILRWMDGTRPSSQTSNAKGSFPFRPTSIANALVSRCAFALDRSHPSPLFPRRSPSLHTRKRARALGDDRPSNRSTRDPPWFRAVPDDPSSPSNRSATSPIHPPTHAR